MNPILLIASYLFLSSFANAQSTSQALVKKAKEGVKVRILVDHGFPIFKLNNYVATELKKYGIEVRYYNTSIILELWKVQFRSHRKLLAVDDKIAVTGSRNIADEYFELSKDYNFLDTDIFINGSVAKKMRESFDAFWDYKISKPAKEVLEPTPKDFQLDQAGRASAAAANSNRS